jgi:glyoxylase-like metal-dependent hydrolase (beta-lactamase superfamily II)
MTMHGTRTVPEMSAEELAARVGTEQEPLLVDVREPEEFEAWAISGARNVPLSHLAHELDHLDRGRETVVVCASGARSGRAVAALLAAGVPAVNLVGGMLAWATVYDTAVLDLERATVVQLRRRGKGCLSYVVGAGDEAFVVDPSLDVEHYLSEATARGWRISRVFDTHLHADHLSGARELSASTGATLHLNPADGFRFPYEPVSEGQWFTLGGAEHFGVTTLATPGHTPGSTSFEVGGRALLAGDTLFVDGIGRPDLADHAVEDSRDLYRSLHAKLLALPVDVTVLPAHYGDAVHVVPGVVVGATIGRLREVVPQLSWGEEELVRWAAGRATPRPPHYAEIVRVNVGAVPARPGLDRRLELGPNRCAA